MDERGEGGSETQQVPSRLIFARRAHGHRLAIKGVLTDVTEAPAPRGLGEAGLLWMSGWILGLFALEVP